MILIRVGEVLRVVPALLFIGTVIDPYNEGYGLLFTDYGPILALPGLALIGYGAVGRFVIERRHMQD